jgi:hypothetical protein
MASHATAKLLFNSVISTPGAKFMTLDIKDFYLSTQMDHYEYMLIKVADICKDIFEHYNLGPLVHNGYVHTEIHRGMHDLPQASRLANDALLPHLAAHGYTPAAICKFDVFNKLCRKQRCARLSISRCPRT